MIAGFDEHVPRRRADAISAGATESELRRRHVALFRGVRVHRSARVTLRMRVDAALLVVTPGSYVSHHTAALLWGGVVPDDPDVHVTSPRNRSRRLGIAAHRTKAGQHVVTWQGVQVTSPAQTFLGFISAWDEPKLCHGAVWTVCPLMANRGGT